MLTRVLLALGRGRQRDRARRLLADEPDVILLTLSGDEDLMVRASRENPDLVVVAEAALPGPPEAAVRQLRQAPGTPDVVVLARTDDMEHRARLRAAGSAAVLFEGLRDPFVRDVIRTILAHRRQESAERLRAGRPGGAPRLADFVSSSPAMQAFLGVVAHVVDSDTSLLVLGETGVGKERLARAVHAEGPRARGPFVAVNCAAFPETLLESELFGHEEGAFSGATRSRRGWFELAHGGTLFLDEIGEMPLHLQVKLLRALQEREIVPLGGERALRVDVRVMAASNRDLGRAAAEGTFRRDLYYRIGVVTLSLPPLRDRREDVPALVASYIEHFRGLIRRDVLGIARPALDALVAYDWPGNVRELMNVVERAVLLCPGGEIGLADLPAGIAGPGAAAASAAPPGGRDREEGAPMPTWARAREAALREAERRYLAELLGATRGRIGEAARRADISTRALRAKMRRHGLAKEAFR